MARLPDLFPVSDFFSAKGDISRGFVEKTVYYAGRAFSSAPPRHRCPVHVAFRAADGGALAIVRQNPAWIEKMPANAKEVQGLDGHGSGAFAAE